ncbi:DUF4900 domain-containing protein [Deinococcus navajonensis]|uniref:DUF4900 domain-containing protein n=1 Tax=Deinococcus navajonensis TaxID=309884 RepID=A0ABV8XM61_9DEIO
MTNFSSTTRAGGYIVVTALIMMVILMLLASIIMTGSVSGVQQAGGHSGLVRARAAAEAGQAQAAFTLDQTVLPGLNAVLTPYAVTFLQSGSSAATTQIVPNNRFSNVETALNALNGMSQNGSVRGATFTRSIVFDNFRVDSASFNTMGQVYYVDYVVTSDGQLGTYHRQVVVNGTLRINMGRTSLNQSLLLANDGGCQQGNYFGTGMNYDGPVQINNNWCFAGSPIFAMGAKTASATVGMWSCTARTWQFVATQFNGCTTPNWGGVGLQYSVPAVALPVNSFSQARAALGQDPSVLGAVTNAFACNALNVSCPGNSAPAAGVYLPTNGGIYVQGDAQVRLSVNSGAQVYTLQQGSQTTTIRVSYPNGPTVMTRPDNTVVTLNNYKPNGQLYVNGTITHLGGPARTGALPNPLPANNTVPSQIPPAIASETQLNIAARDDIVIQGDLTYQTSPVGNPAARNVLGLIAGAGSVRIGQAAPNDLYLHGALLAGAGGQGFKVDNYDTGTPRGSLHLLGSLAEDQEPPRGVGSIAANGTVSIVHGYGDAFNFDQRFLNGNMAPPYFPGSTLFSAQTALPTQRDWTEN